jgi:hypothetical protein
MESEERNKADIDVHDMVDTSIVVSYGLKLIFKAFNWELHVKEVDKIVPTFSVHKIIDDMFNTINYPCLPCPDQRLDDLKGDQTFDVEATSLLVFEYMEKDEPFCPGLDLYSKDRVKVKTVYIYEAEVGSPANKSRKSKSSMSKLLKKKSIIGSKFSELNESSPKSPRKPRIGIFDDPFADMMMKLPSPK